MVALAVTEKAAQAVNKTQTVEAAEVLLDTKLKVVLVVMIRVVVMQELAAEEAEEVVALLVMVLFLDLAEVEVVLVF
jgi:hypothetical protein